MSIAARIGTRRVAASFELCSPKVAVAISFAVFLVSAASIAFAGSFVAAPNDLWLPDTGTAAEGNLKDELKVYEKNSGRIALEQLIVIPDGKCASCARDGKDVLNREMVDELFNLHYLVQKLYVLANGIAYFTDLQTIVQMERLQMDGFFESCGTDVNGNIDSFIVEGQCRKVHQMCDRTSFSGYIGCMEFNPLSVFWDQFKRSSPLPFIPVTEGVPSLYDRSRLDEYSGDQFWEHFRPGDMFGDYSFVNPWVVKDTTLSRWYFYEGPEEGADYQGEPSKLYTDDVNSMSADAFWIWYYQDRSLEAVASVDVDVANCMADSDITDAECRPLTEIMDEWERLFVDATRAFSDNSDVFTALPNSYDVYGNEVGDAVLDDLPVIIASICLVIIFTLVRLNVGRYRNAAKGVACSPLLELGAFFGLLLAAAGGLGIGFNLPSSLAAYTSFYVFFVTIVSASCQSLLLVGHYRLLKIEGTPDAVGVAVAVAAPAITLINLIGVLSYGIVGIISDLPAVTSFCLSCAAGHVLTFVFEMFCVRALLQIDLNRHLLARVDTASGGNDAAAAALLTFDSEKGGAAPEYHGPSAPEISVDRTLKFFEKSANSSDGAPSGCARAATVCTGLGPPVGPSDEVTEVAAPPWTKTACELLTTLFFLSSVIMASVGVASSDGLAGPYGLAQEDALPVDNYLVRYFETEGELFGEVPLPTNLVFVGLDYSDPAVESYMYAVAVAVNETGSMYTNDTDYGTLRAVHEEDSPSYLPGFSGWLCCGTVADGAAAWTWDAWTNVDDSPLYFGGVPPFMPSEYPEGSYVLDSKGAMRVDYRTAVLKYEPHRDLFEEWHQYYPAVPTPEDPDASGPGSWYNTTLLNKYFEEQFLGPAAGQMAMGEFYLRNVVFDDKTAPPGSKEAGGIRQSQYNSYIYANEQANKTLQLERFHKVRDAVVSVPPPASGGFAFAQNPTFFVWGGLEPMEEVTWIMLGVSVGTTLVLGALFYSIAFGLVAALCVALLFLQVLGISAVIFNGGLSQITTNTVLCAPAIAVPFIVGVASHAYSARVSAILSAGSVSAVNRGKSNSRGSLPLPLSFDGADAGLAFDSEKSAEWWASHLAVWRESDVVAVAFGRTAFPLLSALAIAVVGVAPLALAAISPADTTFAWQFIIICSCAAANAKRLGRVLSPF